MRSAGIAPAHRRRAVALLATLAICATAAPGQSFFSRPGNPASHEPVRVIRAELTDNGDGDLWADTRETVAMRLVVWNREAEVHDVVARLETDDPKIACITEPFLTIPHLAAGETRVTDAAFTFVVGDVSRVSLDETFAATFRVALTLVVDGLAFHMPPRELTLDLDLDAVGGAGPTVYFESFEEGFGTFTTMHLDEHLNPPDSDLGNHEAGRLAADGYRCQFNDPDWPPNFHNDNSREECYPAPTGAGDAFWWQVTTDRSFSGASSLHFGQELSPSLGFTTPLAQLEAVRSIDPVNLPWSRTCAGDPGAACTSDGDCPPPAVCVTAAPVLTIRHQADLADRRLGGFRSGSADRAVVMAQAALDDGSPSGPWVRLEPFYNLPGLSQDTRFTNCRFDPIDDGNDEGDFFDPIDPARAFGPSSTCYPAYTFVYHGDTDEPFDPANVNMAIDGPGLAGATGIGTWVESRFDLSRYRGQRVRFRFLTSTFKLRGLVSWEEAFNFNPEAGDDGWFLDDIEVAQALLSPAVLSVDSKPNHDLPGLDDADADGALCDNCPDVPNPKQEDQDGDGRGDACDPCPLESPDDFDRDGTCCPEDVCCSISDPTQSDTDGDGVGDACDNCPADANPGQEDTVLPNGVGDVCDDTDLDGVVDADDNCPETPNPPQADTDGDAVGDDCDNCPTTVNTAQVDRDQDGLGDRCDPCRAVEGGADDGDGDGFGDVCDICPAVADDQADADNDTIGDACDVCLDDPDPDQADRDGDGIGDDCDRCPDGPEEDADGDGLPCHIDPCPTWGPPHVDSDADGTSDRCDDCPIDPFDDADADGHCDSMDNCPTAPNPHQGPAVRISGAFTEGHTLRVFTPDATRVLFHARTQEPAPHAVHLHLATLDGAPPRRLTNRVATTRGAEVVLTPAGARAIFLSDEEEFRVHEVYSVALEGSPTVRLHDPLPRRSVWDFRIVPGGNRVVFVAPATDGERLTAAPTAGGEAIDLGAGLDVPAFELVPGGARVVFLGRPVGTSALALYRVDLDGSDLQQLTTPPATGASEQSVVASPDGAQALFWRSRDGHHEIRSVSLDGGPEVLLDAYEGLGNPALRVDPESADALYVTDARTPGQHELFRVPLSGGPRVVLSEGLPPARSVADFALTAAGDKVVYRAEFELGLRHHLFVTNATGGPSLRLSDGPVAGAGVTGFLLPADGERGCTRSKSPRVPR